MRKDIAVVSLGTSTVCVAIAKGEKNNSKNKYLSFENENSIRVLGVGYQMTRGLKFGSLINLEELGNTLIDTITTAEKEAQKSIKSIIVALPPWAIESQLVDNSINIGDVPVSETQVNSLINFDSYKYISSDSEIIHIFPISYSIDDSDSVQDPIGMVGNKLSVVFHIMSVKSNLIENLKNYFNRSNIEVTDFICSSYASLLSVALNNELSSGVTLIDIGGSCTSISCISDGILLYMGIIPIGGDNITSDISVVLKTNNTNAERLKILYGVSEGSIPLVQEEEQIRVASINEFGEERLQTVPKSTLALIISSRIDEIFEMIKKHFVDNQIDDSYYQNIVITGGGSRISGLSEYIKSKNLFMGSSVRLGKPIGTVGSHDFVKTASFATAAGSILYGLGNFPGRKALKPKKNRTLFQRMKSWFKRGI